MFDGFSDDKVAYAAHANAAIIAAAATAFPKAKVPLLTLAAYCSAARGMYFGQARFNLYREGAPPPSCEVEVRNYIADMVRAAGYEFDVSFFDSVPPEPTAEELAAEIKDLTAKLKDLTTRHKRLTRPEKPRSDQSVYAREYARYRRELRRIDAS